MAPRYLALPTRRVNPYLRGKFVTDGLNHESRMGDLSVFTSNPVVRLGTAGMIVGALIERQTMQSVGTSVTPQVAEGIAASRGVRLIEDFWGGYVAFLWDAKGTIVLRDPSGGTPCLYAEAQGGHVFASDVDLIRHCADAPIVIDWQRVTQSIWDDQICSEQNLSVGHKRTMSGTAVLQSLRRAWSRLYLGSEAVCHTIH